MVTQQELRAWVHPTRRLQPLHAYRRTRRLHDSSPWQRRLSCCRGPHEERRGREELGSTNRWDNLKCEKLDFAY